MLTHDISEFKNKEVRDLAHVLFSPAIIKGKYVNAGKIFTHIKENKKSILLWLIDLDNKPKTLISFLGNRSTSKRLGKYFEHLWHFAFLNSKEVKEVIFSLQVKQDKSFTVGEFDFLINCMSSASWIHLEVAVKFYLASSVNDESGKTTTYFIGPNRKDRLDLKLKKLYEHQLELGASIYGERALSGLGITTVHKELIVKGYLFFNPKHSNDMYIPEYINDYSFKGWWSFINEFEINNEPNQAFVIMNKIEWLSPFLGAGERILSPARFKVLLENRKLELPALVAQVQLLDNGLWKEISRGFLVSEDWGK